MTVENKLLKIKYLRIHNVSIHITFYHIIFLNSRKDRRKDLVFCKICRKTYVLNKLDKTK
jgi:hypothetical protein